MAHQQMWFPFESKKWDNNGIQNSNEFIWHTHMTNSVFTDYNKGQKFIQTVKQKTKSRNKKQKYRQNKNEKRIKKNYHLLSYHRIQIDKFTSGWTILIGNICWKVKSTKREIWKIKKEEKKYVVEEVETEKVVMLRSCTCFQRQRRGSSFEDSSSCRSSEIERGGEITPNSGSLLKLFTSRKWCRQWRKPGRGLSMTKIERSKCFYGFNINNYSIL